MPYGSKSPFLTKSRFKMALECPRKLYYTGDNSFANQKAENDFLKALAAGGFQVGELAKMYFPGGLDLSNERKFQAAVDKTAEELKKENCIIYEAAFVYDQLYIRVDIFVKRGSQYSFYEVKASGWEDSDDGDLIKVANDGKRSINGKKKDYIHDAVFQKYVMQHALGAKVKGHLYFMDKSKATDVDGLNQRFRLVKTDNGGYVVEIEPGFTPEMVGREIMIAKSIDEAYELVMAPEYTLKGHVGRFEELIKRYAVEYENQDPALFYEIGSKCGKCEFRAMPKDVGKKCGFTMCHRASVYFKNQTHKLDQSLVYELWGGGNTRQKSDIISKGFFVLTEIPEAYFASKEAKLQGMHYNERKLKQIEFARTKSKEPYVMLAELKDEMRDWKFPYHFIDFETSRVAIPFYKGGHPYCQVAFQFSHHTMDAAGNIEHKGEWINFNRGEFPNFQFLRELKSQLTADSGTIFRYANHENSVLNDIRRQLQASMEADKDDLIAFIDEITHDSGKKRKGARDMVDLLEVLKRFYIHPDMKGSNSLKAVLPAMLNSSVYLQLKYGNGHAKPVYGTIIPSLNFKEGKLWAVQDETGRFKDPYTLLETFEVGGVSSLDLNVESDEEENYGDAIKDGGAAMMAYQELQFSHVDDERRETIRKALLRYCELDTMAMVMLVEGWRDMCGPL